MKNKSNSGAQRGTKIMECDCEHEFQDSRYGKYKRVHNPTAKKDSDSGVKWRCTVCGKGKE